MKITLSRHEVTATQVALSCALDNEHDKGPDGCGEEVMFEVEEFLGAVGNGSQPVDISLHTLALLHQYLGAIDYAGAFDEEDEPIACERARAALLARIDAFLANTVIASAQSVSPTDYLTDVMLKASGLGDVSGR